jgi:phosphohistidine phosphatase
MDLILWRHAEAEEGADDLARRLTPKGIKQASRIAAWLDSRVPRNARMLVSPAVRAQQTAEALARYAKTSDQVNTGAQAAEVLRAAGWPDGTGTVIIVGHQPTLGAAAALALTGKAAPWRIKKAGVWWLTTRGDDKPVVLAVMTTDLL